MDILIVLTVFFLLAAVVKIAVDNVVQIVKPWLDLKKYKLVIALALTAFGVFAINMGILEALAVPLEVSRSWFHFYDLIITTLFLTGGARAIHKLDKAWKDYTSGGGSNEGRE